MSFINTIEKLSTGKLCYKQILKQSIRVYVYVNMAKLVYFTAYICKISNKEKLMLQHLFDLNNSLGTILQRHLVE